MGAASPSTYHHCPASPAWAVLRPCLLEEKPCVMAGPHKTRMRCGPSCCCCSAWEPAQGMLNLFPESAASPLCKRLLRGELKWGKMPGCHHSTDWCKETLVWGTEHQSCPGATDEFCYTQSQPCSTEHQEPSTLMPQQPLASSRCIPLLQKPRTAAPAAGEPFVCSSQTQQLHFHQPQEQEPSRACGAAAWEMPLSAAQPSIHLPRDAVQAACPALSSAGCIPITAHSMTETLPKAAPLAVCIPSQGLSPCPHPIAALSWAGPIFLGLCCSLQWDSCFPSLFSSYNFLFLPMEGGMLLAVQVPSNLKFGCQVDLAQDELPARQRCSLQKG